VPTHTTAASAAIGQILSKNKERKFTSTSERLIEECAFETPAPHP